MKKPTGLSKERVTREDMVMFINACFACNGQSEFYGDSQGQGVSISFLHEYILGNYRRLYARTLAAGINHFNRSLIIQNLLAKGSPSSKEAREEEGQLIEKALLSLPVPRALRVLVTLRERRINNRRARATARTYLQNRKNLSFDTIKYRSQMQALISHTHLKLPEEVGTFLFEGTKAKNAYQTPLFEAYRQASFNKEAIYELPFTIAEGFAARHRIDRAEFLKKIEPRMTANERLRLQGAAERQNTSIQVDLSRVPLTKLALYILSHSLEEREKRYEEFHNALQQSARRALKRSPIQLGKVAAVLDRSYSSSGSLEKRRRPLAVALSASYLLREAASEYIPFWITNIPKELLLSAGGLTDLATPLVEALSISPDLVIIISDGFENDPPFGASEVARVFRKRLDLGRKTSIVHMNPVFDSERYAPRSLGEYIPTVGLRNTEDLPTMLGFARFADGSAPISELESYLAACMKEFLTPKHSSFMQKPQEQKEAPL